MRWLALSLLSVLLVACGKGELSSPCEDDKDCERGLECVSQNLSPGVIGFQCSAFCANDADCGGGVCLGASCARPCVESASDCPEGSVCADGYCVLPCFADVDCKDTGLPLCPTPGGVCSNAK